MKRTALSILATAVLVFLVLSGCVLSETTPEQRIQAFLSELNLLDLDTADVTELQALQQNHFSPAMNDYALLDDTGPAYWAGTFFDTVVNGTISVSGLVLDSAATGGYEGGVTVTGDITGTAISPTTYPVTFVLVPRTDMLLAVDWFITYILVEDVADPVPIWLLR